MAAKKGISLSKKKKNAQERVAVPVMMDGFPVGVEIDGKENRRGEKRRKSNSRSIRNKKYKDISIILFFSCGGGGEKTWGRGEDQRKESCEIKIPI